MAYYEIRITLPSGARDRFITFLSRKGSLGFIDQESVLIAYFSERFDINALAAEMNALKEVFNRAGIGRFEFSFAVIQEQDWNQTWKKTFKPLDVGGLFTVLPPWEKKQAGRINIIIDPGMAFGTGHHETTRSCLVLMGKYNGQAARETFLDLGTGTGLLAIAASKLGYRRVIAVDTDPLAAEAARHNIRLNEATNIEIRDGSIGRVEGVFDCISANIISGVLIQLAPEIGARMKKSGFAILAGILAEQADEVKTAYQQSELSIIEEYREGKWTALVVQK